MCGRSGSDGAADRGVRQTQDRTLFSHIQYTIYMALRWRGGAGGTGRADGTGPGEETRQYDTIGDETHAVQRHRCTARVGRVSPPPSSDDDLALPCDASLVPRRSLSSGVRDATLRDGLGRAGARSAPPLVGRARLVRHGIRYFIGYESASNSIPIAIISDSGKLCTGCATNGRQRLGLPRPRVAS